MEDAEEVQKDICLVGQPEVVKGFCSDNRVCEHKYYIDNQIKHDASQTW